MGVDHFLFCCVVVDKSDEEWGVVEGWLGVGGED